VLDQLLRQCTIVGEVPAKLPLNPPVADLAEAFNPVLDVSQSPECLEAAVWIVKVEQDRHEGIKGVELCLKLLQSMLLCEVALFDNGEHKLRVLVTQVLTCYRYHELKKGPHCFAPVPFKEVVHRPKNFCKLAVFTVPSVIHFKFFEEVLADLAEGVFTDRLATQVREVSNQEGFDVDYI